MFTKYLNKIRTGSLVKGAGILMVSTIISQIIVIAFSPILTRIYTPEEYSYLILFNSVVNYFAVISTMRYEYAVLVPEEKKEGAQLLLLSFSIAILVSTLSFFSLLILKALNFSFGSFFFLVPIVVLGFGVQQTILNWFNRTENYNFIAIGTVSLVLCGVVCQLIFSFSSFGLVFGRVMAIVFSSSLLGFLYKQREKLPKFNKERLLEVAHKYKKFPIYNAPQAFVTKSSVELPIIILAIYFQDASIAFYGLANKILLLPLGFIGNALSKPIIPKVLALKKYEDVRSFLLKLQLMCFAVFIPIALIIFFLGEPLFEFVFGEGWGRAGLFAKILLPFFMFRFMGSPIAILGSLIGYQERMLILSIVRVIGVFISLYAGGVFFGIEGTLLAYSLFGAVYWIFSIFHTFYLFKLKLND